jgi:hypothetical protein
MCDECDKTEDSLPKLRHMADEMVVGLKILANKHSLSHKDMHGITVLMSLSIEEEYRYLELKKKFERKADIEPKTDITDEDFNKMIFGA